MPCWRKPLAVASLSLLCVAALLLPSTVAYLNRATIILWGMAVVAAIMRAPRPRLIPDLAMAAFLLWSLITAFWEYSAGLAVPQALQLLALVIGGEWLLLSVQAYDPAEIRWLRRAVLGGFILGLGLMFIDWLDGCAILIPVQILRDKYGTNGCWLPYLKTAPTMLAIMTPILWAWRRWVAVAEIAGLIVLARATDSHATLLALGLSGGVYGMAAWLGAGRIAKALAILVVGFVVGAPVLIQLIPPSKELAIDAPWLPNSSRHRAIIWQFADQLIQERPLLGWGLNNARAVPGGNDKVDVWSKDANGRIFALEQPRMPLHPHNMALQIWLETGLVGALLAVWALWRIVLRLGSAVGAPGLAAATAAFSVGMVSFGAWQAWWLASLWLFAAFSLLLLRPEPTAPNVVS